MIDRVDVSTSAEHAGFQNVRKVQDPRHYCVMCHRKLIQRRMIQLALPYTGGLVWLCREDFNTNPSRASVVVPFGTEGKV